MNLKLLLIPVFVIGIDAAPLLFRRYVPWHKLGAAIAGTVCGAAAVIGFLVLKHVNINDAYQFVYAYHAAIASEFKRSPGLLAMLVDINRAQYFLPTVFAVIGFFMLVTDWKAETIQKNKFALVFLLFSVAQTILVPFPFKQYMCSVFLMWIAPLAVTYDRWLSGKSHRIARGTIIALTVIAVGIGLLRQYYEQKNSLLKSQRSIFDQFQKLAPVGTTVIGVMTHHPLFRHDAAYVFFSTMAPGPQLIKTMRHIRPQDTRFTVDELLQEIRKNKPSLVIQSDIFQDPPLLAAVGTYLREEAANYTVLQRDKHSGIYVRVAGQ
jgi:hypothetical protein